MSRTTERICKSWRTNGFHFTFCRFSLFPGEVALCNWLLYDPLCSGHNGGSGGGEDGLVWLDSLTFWYFISAPFTEENLSCWLRQTAGLLKSGANFIEPFFLYTNHRKLWSALVKISFSFDSCGEGGRIHNCGLEREGIGPITAPTTLATNKSQRRVWI